MSDPKPDDTDEGKVPSRLANTLDTRDPGDETQRNFRYQHSYGVILLTAAARGAAPYVAIWCEHHDDYLCERVDGRFDAYQIKSRRPELGPWTTSDEELRSALKRFVALVRHYPTEVHQLFFVSNAECLDSGAKGKVAISPIRLLAAVRACSSEDDLAQPFRKTLDDLATHCECTAGEMLQCLRRLAIVKGPSRESFEAEIAHNHLPFLPGCSFLTRYQLNSLRDELVQMVHAASSLKVDSPDRHLSPVDATDRRNPELLSKRLVVEVVLQSLAGATPFRFYPTKSELSLGQTNSQRAALAEKMSRGGISAYVEMMERRALSAEAHLIELSHANPDIAETLLNQLEHLVLGECQEAYLEASLTGEPFGPLMLADLHRRLRVVATSRAPIVHHQPYECLVGVAALFTCSCKVWWSTPFPLGGVT